MEQKNVSKQKSTPSSLYRIVFLVNYEEWIKLRDLVHYYGVSSYPDALRLALAEAYENIDTGDHPIEETVESEDETAENEDGENNEVENEDQEETPTLEDEARDFAQTLDTKGKQYLTETLSEPFNPRHRNVHLGGARPEWQDKITSFVNDACGWDGTRKTSATANQTRKNLLAYLKEEGILAE